MKQTLLPIVIAVAALPGIQAQAVKNVLPLTPPSVSTVPSNGDVNPYGVAFVPKTVPTDGVLQQGDILVSNFNNNQNLQGTGSTIVRVSQTGTVSTFYQGQHGLSAAVGLLSNGVVIVGNLPTADGTAATAQPGALTFIDRYGNVIGSLTGNGIDGPWGLAIGDPGTGTAQVFVSNVLNGTIERYNVTYSPTTLINVYPPVTIGSGFNHRSDPAALEVGPSGLYYDAPHDVLYVASSDDNAVYAITTAGALTGTAGRGTAIYQDLTHLHGPIDIVLAPNGHLLVANSDGSNANATQPSELVEFTTSGTFVSEYSIDPNNGGAFGLSLFVIGFGTIRVAAVDDNANTLNLWTTFAP
jgi:hypothetical protein